MNDIELSSGAQIPSVGLGLWKVADSACPQLIEDAVDAGYRHFDCACDYGNEAAVGEGFSRVLEQGKCTREDLWVTSKLWNTFHRPEHVELACRKTLTDLKLDHLDLYLIHFPIAQKFVPIEERYPPGWFADPDAENPVMEFDRVAIADTWQAMEKLKTDGLVSNIGVCNFGTSLLRDLLNYADIRPTVLQVESHPYLTQDKLLQFCHEQQIAYTAFSPFGALSYHELGMAASDDSLLTRSDISNIAEAHQKSAAQVLLRWGIQRGTAVIPKTSSRVRLAENIDVFDFELTDSEMKTIGDLNLNRRYNDPGVFCQSAFNTFCPIYE